jgi:hypothetical protein
MSFALCPGPLLSAGELFELLMFVASCCSLFALALICFVKWVEAGNKRLAEEYSLGLNDE